MIRIIVWEKERKRKKMYLQLFMQMCVLVLFLPLFFIRSIIYHRQILYDLFFVFSYLLYSSTLIYFFTRVTVKTTKLRGITLSNFITITLSVVLAQLYRRYFTPRHLWGERLGGFDRWNWRDTVTRVCLIWLSITHRNKQLGNRKRENGKRITKICIT